MNTFLPYPSFVESASCLDRARLGKQRVEVLQILNVLTGKRTGWCNHPAVRMWRGYEACLALYGLVMCLEWTNRGYNDSVANRLEAKEVVAPPWLGDAAFHASHRSNLLRKDIVHYSKFGWQEPASLPYIWPV